jgi:hypothetical protein
MAIITRKMGKQAKNKGALNFLALALIAALTIVGVGCGDGERGEPRLPNSGCP